MAANDGFTALRVELGLTCAPSPTIPISRQQAGAGFVDSAISAGQHDAAGRAVLRFGGGVARGGVTFVPKNSLMMN